MKWWTAKANCNGEDPDIFFSNDPRQIRRATALCSTCPVSGECLEFILGLEKTGDYYRDGIYGGKTPKERRRLA